MLHHQILTCSHCRSDNLTKNGHRNNGTQRWRCNNCKKSFQFEYRNNARKSGVKEKIIEMTLNGSGVRDISRVLKISQNTVILALKKKTPNLNPHIDDIIKQIAEIIKVNALKYIKLEIRCDVEMDEFWSYVGKKKNQRWTWYALEKITEKIFAWHNGKRTDDDCKMLLKYLEDITVTYYFTDSYGSCERLLPERKHYVGKDETQNIERKNLNFRTHIKRLCRKTICFSKSETIHDNVIGMYIEKHYFQPL